jgi:hypothetical protein
MTSLEVEPGRFGFGWGSRRWEFWAASALFDISDTWSTATAPSSAVVPGGFPVALGYHMAAAGVTSVVCFVSWWKCSGSTLVLESTPLHLSGELLSCLMVRRLQARREGRAPLPQENMKVMMSPRCFVRSRSPFCSWQCLAVFLWLLLFGADELRSLLLQVVVLAVCVVL